MGFREFLGKLKRVFLGSRSREAEKQKKINHELQAILEEVQSSILKSLKATVEENISARRDREIEFDQLKKENRILRNDQYDLRDKIPSFIEIQRNFKRMDDAINNLELQIKDKQNKIAELQFGFNRLEAALKEQKVCNKKYEMVITQLQESSADAVSRITAQEDTVKTILEMVSGLTVELKVEQNKNTDLQNKIHRLEIASNEQKEITNIKIEEKEKDIAHIQESSAKNVSGIFDLENTVRETLEMVSDLSIELKDEQNMNTERNTQMCATLVKQEGLVEENFKKIFVNIDDVQKQKMFIAMLDDILSFMRSTEDDFKKSLKKVFSYFNINI